MRDSLQSVLSRMSGAMVVGSAADEQSAIRSIGTLLPDVVILDLSLKSGLGISVLENIKRHHATIKVIVFFSKSFQLMQIYKALWKCICTERSDNLLKLGSKLNALRMTMR